MSSNVSENAFVIHPDADLLQRHPELKHAGNALVLKYAFNELVTEDELKNIGDRLWQVLDKAYDFEQARQVAGVKILPVIIESDNAAIQQLPWETLHHPEQGFVGKSEAYTLSRCIMGVTADHGQLETGPLRVLLFTSLPDDLDAETARLNVEEEQAQVQEALMPWIAKGIVELEMPDDGRFATLKQQLKVFQPHLVFLSGHGKFNHQPHIGQAPYSTFLFESETGTGEAIRETDIAGAFIGSRVQCVVLSACESGKAASVAVNNGLARQLSLLGIPYVIGMRESVIDRAGILFARHFCDAIARKERVDIALQQARHAINTPLRDIPRRDTEDVGLAELSLGQWCLPMLILRHAARPLIDWNFVPQTVEQRLTNLSLKTISLPLRFLGRRKELRQLKGRILSGELQQLLITGPGGQGKTALAGKLAQDCQQHGYEILAWSAKPENNWSDFLFELQMQLNNENAKLYDRMVGSCTSETDVARLLLRLLLSHSPNRIVLFFDNLESIQQPKTLELNDPRMQAWIAAAQALVGQGLVLLLTSRWTIPGWPDAAHWGLEHASYGDFLQMAQQHSLSPEFFRNRSQLRRVYDTLHGNGRGLEFFAGAIQGMNLSEENAFLEKLTQAEEKIQADMALEQIINHLSPDEQALLQRLPAYHTPVPIEGIIKLALDMSQAPETMLKRLLSVSLVEQQYSYTWQTDQYQCSPLVTEWLQKQHKPAPNRQQLRTAAKYQSYLFRSERPTLSQAIIAHQALRAAGERDEADRFALDRIIGRLGLHGFRQRLLSEWLPDICESENKQIQAEALGQTGNQHYHMGDYDTALNYLKQSLTIQQEIGDKSGEGETLINISHIYCSRDDYDTAFTYMKQSLAIQQEIGDKSGEGGALINISHIFKARGDYDMALNYLKQSLTIQQEIGDIVGLCATLFNIGHIHHQNEHIQQSMQVWVSVYRLAKPLNLAEVLDALENLAERLELPGGIDGWEGLTRQMEENDQYIGPDLLWASNRHPAMRLLWTR
jgi:tetratricopeptide (TPR) repeat protein